MKARPCQFWLHPPLGWSVNCHSGWTWSATLSDTIDWRLPNQTHGRKGGGGPCVRCCWPRHLGICGRFLLPALCSGLHLVSVAVWLAGTWTPSARRGAHLSPEMVRLPTTRPLAPRPASGSLVPLLPALWPGWAGCCSSGVLSRPRDSHDQGCYGCLLGGDTGTAGLMTAQARPGVCRPPPDLVGLWPAWGIAAFLVSGPSRPSASPGFFCSRRPAPSLHLASPRLSLASQVTILWCFYLRTSMEAREHDLPRPLPHLSTHLSPSRFVHEPGPSSPGSPWVTRSRYFFSSLLFPSLSLCLLPLALYF
jgi:hypothetical protein